MSFLTVATAFVLTLFSIQRETANFREELLDQSNLLLESTSISLRDSLYRLEQDELREYARVLVTDPDVQQVVFYDREGRILVNSENVEESYSQTIDPLGSQILAQKGIYTEWKNDRLVAGKPVQIGNQVVGAVIVGFSTNKLTIKIQEISMEGLLAALLVLAGSSLLTLGILPQITHPLAELTNVAKQMSWGNLHVRAKTKGNDEIGQLGQVFNQMAAAMQERENALRDLATSLENTVTQRTAALREQTVMLEQMAITDPLTQVYNRRHFFILAEKEMERASRGGTPMSVILIDADHFKQINDTYGHPSGDRVLIHLAQICQKYIRARDVFARYGGEEFILLLPETNLSQATFVAERVRKALAENGVMEKDQVIPVTISLGIAVWTKTQPVSFSTLLSQADQALYRAKQSGRNQVCSWESNSNFS